jgi:hypothetical protein
MILEILSFIFTIIAIIAVAFVALFFYNFFKIVSQQDRFEQVAETIRENIRIVYAEKIKGIIYLYDQATGVFIAQGRNENEMWENAQQRFPEFDFVLTAGELGNTKVVTFNTEGELNDNEKSL